jgi:D-glycero-D-manno-heptose 1,7-bisphosphate phosphatase
MADNRRLIPVLYLDIDGTVREGKDDPLGRFVNGPEDVRVFPEAVERMRQWRQRGGRIVGVSNQGGIALGHCTQEDVDLAMDETDRQTGGLFDLMVSCPHHPEASDPHERYCWCRKPMPGLVIGSAVLLGQRHPDERYAPALALYVGDRDEDVMLADALSLRFEWAKDWRAG